MIIGYLHYIYLKWFGTEQQKTRVMALEIIHDEMTKQKIDHELFF